MKYLYRCLYLFGLMVVLTSCKKEVKDLPQETTTIPIPKKKDLTEIEKDQVNSVLAKAMVTKELKTFVSTLVTTELTEMLYKQEGPFTLVAPSNIAFDKVNRKKMEFLLNQENKAELKKLVSSHIIEGKLDTATLVQNIKDGNGRYKIITISGATYTASRDNTDIVLTDVKGVKATIGKSDIIGSNGLVHVIDRVLAID